MSNANVSSGRNNNNAALLLGPPRPPVPSPEVLQHQIRLVSGPPRRRRAAVSVSVSSTDDEEDEEDIDAAAASNDRSDAMAMLRQALAARRSSMRQQEQLQQQEQPQQQHEQLQQQQQVHLQPGDLREAQREREQLRAFMADLEEQAAAEQRERSEDGAEIRVRLKRPAAPRRRRLSGGDVVGLAVSHRNDDGGNDNDNDGNDLDALPAREALVPERRSRSDGDTPKAAEAPRRRSFFARLFRCASAAPDAAAAKPKATFECQVCFDDGPADEAVAAPCGRGKDKCETVVCRGCASRVLATRVRDAFGMCPKMPCPGCNASLRADQWRPLADEETVRQYDRNAAAMLTLQCGSCHSRRSMLHPAPAGRAAAARKSFVKALAKDDSKLAEAFDEAVTRYERHELPPAGMFDVVARVLELRGLGGARLQRDFEELTRARHEAVAAVREWREKDELYISLQTRKYHLTTEQRAVQADVAEIKAGLHGLGRHFMGRSKFEAVRNKLERRIFRHRQRQQSMSRRAPAPRPAAPRALAQPSGRQNLLQQIQGGRALHRTHRRSGQLSDLLLAVQAQQEQQPQEAKSPEQKDEEEEQQQQQQQQEEEEQPEWSGTGVPPAPPVPDMDEIERRIVEERAQRRAELEARLEPAEARLAVLTQELRETNGLAAEVLKARREASRIPEMDQQLAAMRNKMNEMPEHEVAAEVLPIFADAERRASLQLRWLNVHPRVRTKCCRHVHCFRCKLKNGHQDGKTCEEYLAARLSDDVKMCPGCSLAVVKGDGCDHITCICGHSFSFSSARAVGQ